MLFDWVGALGGVPAQPGELTVPAAAHDVVVTTWSSAARVVRHPHVEKSRFYRALEEEEEEDGDGVREAAAAQQEKEPDAAPQQAAGNDAPASQVGIPVLAEAADALEGSVRYWTDYSKAVLHPRTAVLFSAPWGIDTPDGYGATHEYTDGTAAEEAHERIRCAPGGNAGCIVGLPFIACAHCAGTLPRSVTRWPASTSWPTTAAHSGR